MSHEVAKEEAFTISSQDRLRRVRGCRIVIQVPVSATREANRADLDSTGFIRPWLSVQFLNGPRRRGAAWPQRGLLTLRGIVFRKTGVPHAKLVLAQAGTTPCTLSTTSPLAF